ncbi:MAG: DUF6062 family protein [Chloroflexota bacterium]
MKPLNYYDFLQYFAQPGCLICNLVERDVAKYLDSLMYEYVNAPITHEAMRASRGLCAQHNGQLVDYGASVLGISILQSVILDEVLKISGGAPGASGGSALARLRGSLRKGVGLADNLEAAGSCSACDALLKAEQLHVDALAFHIDDTDLADAFRGSNGLCLPHFRLALRAAPGAAHVEMLVTIQTAIWGNLKAELDEFARKYDINHADESMGAEGDSWRRALSLVAGARRVFGLRR